MDAWMRKTLQAHSKHIFIFLLILAGAFSLVGCSGNSIGILNPKGIIAAEERKLLFDTLALMLIVVLPVIVMSIVFVMHYRAANRISDYKPNWSHSYFLESLWWGIPCVIITILAVLTYVKTHQLDPFNKIPGQRQPTLQIQAIALPWKWLFIYPEQHIGTMNLLVLPVNRQIEFSMTVDNTPMSALFIPQLGSQIYAMAGMRSKLYLQAQEIGTYDGMNTQFSGAGFSDMHFPVRVVSQDIFDQWVKKTKQLHQPLDQSAYSLLLNPSIGDKPQLFSSVTNGLFEQVIEIYMTTYGPVHPRNNQIKFYNEVE